MSADAKVYIKGRAADAHEAHHHVMPISTYLKVFGALMVLTVLTVVVSYLDLGPLALGVAMLVAVIKAAAVIGYFMHLKFDTRFHTFVFLSTLLFVAIFFTLTFFDLKTRDMMNQTWDSHAYARDAGLDQKPALRDTRPLTAEEIEHLKTHGHH
ncbi:MAG: cytochrome C oxidase subunit IV family protein [Deltaproteobacteria bacterium]|jgi:cytochrome c oxidase subunit 4|nr:cytochrome C oxidase subunit IV family protein [Deltaproteobacteria bacterium]